RRQSPHEAVRVLGMAPPRGAGRPSGRALPRRTRHPSPGDALSREGPLLTHPPNILREYVQVGGRAGFQIRLVLAATLGATYGIYGPPFELCEAEAIPGTEEYRHAEKYEIRHWDLERPDSLRAFITRVNEIRRENAAFRSN